MCVWSAIFGRNNERRKEKQCLAGYGEEPFLGRDGGVVVIMNREWHEGKGFKYGRRAQRRMEDIG